MKFFDNFFDPDHSINLYTTYHFAACALLAFGAAHAMAPIVAVVVVGLFVGGAFELGQWDDARSVPNRLGTPGFGFGLVDLAADVAGAIAGVIVHAVMQ